LAGADPGRETFQCEQVPFAHPLWILFSSGTTGLPKAIVHCHGGITLEQFQAVPLPHGPARAPAHVLLHQHGWMMWNFLASSLLMDAVPVLYDGNPAWPTPDLLWKMADDTGAHLFGASPTYQAILEKAGIVPKDRFALAELEHDRAAGSPVTAKPGLVLRQREARSVGALRQRRHRHLLRPRGRRREPAYLRGRIQARQLGVAAYAFDEQGRRWSTRSGNCV
jgi:acetoacetyl-CoA synthetase